MNSFVNALSPRTIKNNNHRTFNGAVTNDSSQDAIVDLFFLTGASRGQDILPAFKLAYDQNRELAARTMLYARDVREGQGEREHFRNVMRWLERNDMDLLMGMLPRVADLGRFDDLLIFEGPARTPAFKLYHDALLKGNGLAAKWAPRKGPVMVALRAFLNLSPKQYRRLIVALSKTVEQNMCANMWYQINYDQVPSIAAARYRKAFYKHDPVGYAAYVAELSKPNTSRKINAGAIYPYDIIRQIYSANDVELNAIEAQWKALPDFVGNGSFLPMVDASGSMFSWTHYNQKNNNKTKASPFDIASSLGLYLSERNKSAFQNVLVTFDSNPKIQHMRGSLYERAMQLKKNVGYSTNLELAFAEVLTFAVRNKVPQTDMPEAFIVLSDMEFNPTTGGTLNHARILEMYEQHGYVPPKLIWWNLNGRLGNSPVTVQDKGTALVSGFSPSIMKNLLKGADMSPLSVVMETISNPRYDLSLGHDR